MPQCPNCQTPYEEGQRYCKNCGSFLLHREQGDTFCPQCGVRVSPRQEFCHECDAPLIPAPAAPEAEAPPPASEAPPEKPPAPAAGLVAGTPNWLLALLAGSGVVIIILLILLFTRGTSPPPVPPMAAKAPSPAAPPAATKPAPATPAPGAQPPAAPAPVATTPATPAPETPAAPANLKKQLQQTLSLLREAQLNKDIIKFMSAYSFTYPELEAKRANTLKTWEDYDFTSLVFTVDKVQPLDADNVIAWVTWYIDTKNRDTQDMVSSTQTYKVRFSKELGKWRIRSLEEMEK